MEKFKFQGKRFSMPTGWHEVSFEDAMTIFYDQLDEVQSFSLLSGIPLEECRKIEDEETIACFMFSFGFIRKTPDPRMCEIPMSIKLGSETLISPSAVYEDITDFGKMSIGQIGDMKETYINKLLEIKGVEEDWQPNELEILDLMPDIVSIFVQKILDQEYDNNKAKSLVPRIRKEMSFKDVAYIGYFFLKRLNALMNGWKADWQTYLPTKKKLRRGLKSLMRNLDFTKL